MINRRLYDILLRHQMYVDGYKNYLMLEWNDVLSKFVKDLKSNFNDLNYKTLDQMSKKDFNNFKNNVRTSILECFENWQNSLQDQLKEFTKVDCLLQKQILASYLSDKTISDENQCNEIIKENETDTEKKRLIPLAWIFGNENDNIYNAIENNIMGATGTSLLDYITTFGEKIADKVDLGINVGLANVESIQDILSSIIGTPENKWKDGFLPALDRNGKNLINTSVQEFSIDIESGVTSAVYDMYIWVAVLDFRVCPDCLFLNGQKFYVGAGPTSPYHIHCRCSNIPFTGNEIPDEKSVEQWMLQQPESVRTDIVNSNQIDLATFSSKLNNILTD